MINIKEFLDNVTLKSLSDIQKSIATETERVIHSVTVNGKPLDKLKKEVRH